MDSKEDIVKKTEFDPYFQPFGHEQPKFIDVVEKVFSEPLVSEKFTDSQKEVFALRFPKDKSYKEISVELGIPVEEVEEIRDRGVKNLFSIFFDCDIDLQNIFEEEDLVKKIKDGYQDILNSFDKWLKQGIFTEYEVEVTKHYSKNFNGLGNKDLPVEDIMASGISERAKLRDGDDRRKVREIVRNTTRFFYAKHFKESGIDVK